MKSKDKRQKAKSKRQPQTAAEWQEAVDTAYFLLMLDAARKYGFVSGGPEVNIRRCEQFLETGKKFGIEARLDF